LQNVDTGNHITLVKKEKQYILEVTSPNQGVNDSKFQLMEALTIKIKLSKSED
jgi:hypothetical protein